MDERTLCNGYVVVRRSDGAAVWEFWRRSIVKKINRKKYAVMTTYNYLCGQNKEQGS